jgi:plastocyanin
MVCQIGIFTMIALIVSGIFSVLPTEVFANQIIHESKPLIQNVAMLENASNAANTASSNNTIILNVAEVREEEGEEEKAEQGYRWVNSTGEENPDLNIISNTEYTIKTDNPTDEEHQLIIDSKSNGKTIAESEEIKPGKNVEFKFKTDQVGGLGYHCKYHPNTMNGTINVS